MLAMLCVKRRTIPLKARNFAHFVILASVDGIGFGLFRVAPGGLEMAAEPDDGDQHEGAEDRQRGQRHDEGEKENVGDRAPQERPDLARHRRCIEPRHRNERRLQFGGVMFKFEAVSQQVFTANMSTLRHSTKNHDCISDGLFYVDQKDNIIGVKLPGRGEAAAFYFAIDPGNP